MATVTLVLGGARSGKSVFAEELAARSAQPVYLATAQALDAEMKVRICTHKARRGAQWNTFEVPLALVETLGETCAPGRTILVDCLTLWVSNLMHAQIDIDEQTQALVESLAQLPGDVVLVSNEVGLGLVPETSIGREFRDHAGRLHQAVAAVADHVYLLVAGIPMTVK